MYLSRKHFGVGKNFYIFKIVIQPKPQKGVEIGRATYSSRIPTLLKRILTQCILRCFYFNFILSIYIYSFLVKEHKTYLYRFSNNTGSLNLYSIFNSKNFPSLFRLGLIKKNIFYMFFLCAMTMVPLVI